jgi:peptidoglycan/LPS O-acetylase OafA/YrhL
VNMRAKLAEASALPLPKASATVELHGHLPVLDGIRGLAVMMVLIFHFVGQMLTTNAIEHAVVAVTKQGLLGVDLFFVLSGFLITGLLYEARDKPHFLRNFYIRRVLRIFPLYYGVLAIIFFVAPLIPLFQGTTLDFLLERQAWAWTYAVNIYLALHTDWSFSYLNHFWSLCVEEHFYLVWPLVVLLLARRPNALMATCLAISVGAMLARVIGIAMGLNWWVTVVLTPFKLDGLALGAFLAVLLRQPRGPDWLQRTVTPIAAVVIGLLAVSYVWTGLVSRTHLELVGAIRASLFQVLLACLLIWILMAPKQHKMSRLFSSRPMVFFGTYSYGLYVYHHFISYYLVSNRTELDLAPYVGSHGLAVALQATVGIALSVAVAYFSYEIFEKRFLRLKRRFAV